MPSELPIFVRAFDETRKGFASVVDRARGMKQGVVQQIGEMETKFKNHIKVLRTGFDSLISRMTGFSPSGIGFGALLPIIVGLAVAVRGLPKLWDGFITRLDRADNLGTRLKITFKNLLTAFDGLANSFGTLIAEGPGVMSLFEGVNAIAKGLAGTLTLVEHGIRAIAASKKLFDAFFEKDPTERLKKILDFGKEMEQIEARTQSRLEDIFFEIDRTADAAGKVKKELSEWEKIVFGIRDKMQGEQRGGLVDALQMLTDPAKSSSFKSFLGNQVGEFADVAMELGTFYLQLQEGERDLLERFFEGTVTRSSELQQLADLFQALEGNLSNVLQGDGMRLSDTVNLLPQVIDLVDQYKASLASLVPEVNYVQVAFQNMGEGIGSAMFTAFEAVIVGEQSMKQALRNIAAEGIRSLVADSKQRAIWNLGMALSRFAVGDAWGGGMHLRAAAQFGIIAAAGTAAASAIAKPTQGDSSVSRDSFGRRRDEVSAGPSARELPTRPGVTVVVNIQNAVGVGPDVADKLGNAIGNRLRDQRVYA